MRATVMCSLLLALACGGGESTPPSSNSSSSTAGGGAASVPTDPDQKAVEVAKAIQKNADDADAILASYGMTVESFEALMYEIAMDPDRSARFSAALAG